MKRLDVYLGKTVVSTTVLVWLLVLILDALFVLLGQLGDIGRGDYDLVDAALFVALGLPTRAWQMFPVAVLIGAVLGLGNLAAQRELTAFRLAGCSIPRLFLAVLYGGVFLLIPVLPIGEGWAPHSQLLAEQLRSQALFENVSVQSDAGFWVRDGRRFIQVARSEADGSLSQVNVYQVDNSSRLERVVSADNARPQSGTWSLSNVAISEFQIQSVSVEHREEVVWPQLMEVRLAQLLTRPAGTLSLSELQEYIAYLRRNGSDVSAYRLNFWQRVSAPLTTLAMLFLAVILVLGGVGGYSLGQRLLIAVMAGLGFKLLSGLIAHAGQVYGMNPLLSALIPALVVFSAAGVGLIRIENRRGAGR